MRAPNECGHVIARDERGRCLLCVFPSLDPTPPEPEPNPEALDVPAIDPGRAALKRLRAAAAKRCRESFKEFVRLGWHVLHPAMPDADWNWHLDVICDHVQATMEELFRARRDPTYVMRWQNILINVPPRSGKTVIIGSFLLPWLWLRDPALKYRYISGNPRMVSFTARTAKDVILSRWYQDTFQPEWTIRGDIDAVGLFANTARGERHSSSLGANIVGEGTDIIIMDDPMDPDDAYSEVKRQGVETAWNESIANRVNNPRASARLGIMQRLHEVDWSWLVLSQGWHHVCLPMEREAKPFCKCRDCEAGETVLGWRDTRAIGERLHPARFSDEFLASERHRLQSYGWAGQMQQRPAPEGGGVFRNEWFRRIDPSDLPRMDQTMIFCDLTFGGENPGTSRNALMVAGRVGPKRYILDVIAKAMDIVAIKATIRELHRQYPKAQILIENKAAGAPVVAEMKRDLSGIIEYDPGSRDKISRAMSVQPYVEAGDVLLLKGASWLDEFLHELGTFPNGRWDDQVDALSMMLDYWRSARGVLKPYKI